jgi:glycosyltransferase involved in cell wall biosynthesis
MRLSVAMTTHNSERYLEPMLESIARQTRVPDELVVRDDASRDSTVAMLEAFAERAPFPVRVEADEVRRGHAYGFLRAASLCSGEVVAYCDADDVWLERKLETCERSLAATAAPLVLHSVRVVDAGLRQIAADWPEIGATRLVPPLGYTGLYLDAPGMAMAFQRELLELADWSQRPPSKYDGGVPMMHDEYTVFMAGAVGPIQLLSEPLALYRQHESNYAGWFERPRGRSLVPALDDYRMAKHHTESCARFLETAAAAGGPRADRLAEAARHYRRAAANWDGRLRLYGSRDRRTRARAFGRLVGARAYGSRVSGGLGLESLCKDVVAGVALRRPR